MRAARLPALREAPQGRFKGVMKITVRRYGGLAGISEIVAVKDTGVHAITAGTLIQNVDRLRRLSENQHPEGADFIHYEVLIEERGTQELIKFADDGSEKARGLLEVVNTIAPRSE